MDQALQGVAAARTFTEALGSSGVELVLAWALAALAVSIVALTGTSRPTLQGKWTAGHALALVVLVLPVAVSQVWADKRSSALTGEIVPSFIGAETDRLLGIALTDRDLVEHRRRVPGVLDPAYRLLQSAGEAFTEVEQLPLGAIVVDPGETRLQVADVILAVDGQRVESVESLLVQIAETSAEALQATVDREGTLVEVGLTVLATAD